MGTGRRRRDQLPQHRRHKASKRGYVSLGGFQHYTGPWPDADRPAPPGTEAEYNRLLMLWIAGGRKGLPARSAEGGRGVTVADVAGRWAESCRREYTKDRGDGKGDRPTSYADKCRRVAARVAAIAGAMPAEEFNADAMKVIRDYWTQTGCSRKTVNQYCQMVRLIFGWAADEARLISDRPWHALAVVRPLRKGRAGAKDRPRVRAASEGVLEAVLAAVKDRMVRDMVRLAALCSMRPGEVRMMRLAEVDRDSETVRSSGVWLYRPTVYKTMHEDEDAGRVVPIGPKAQAILKPYLDRAGRYRHRRGFVFLNRYGNPFDHSYFARKLLEARRRAGIEDRVTPNVARHVGATRLRAAYGLDVAQIVLGHKDSRTTERWYAELPLEKAIQAAKESG